MGKTADGQSSSYLFHHHVMLEDQGKKKFEVGGKDDRLKFKMQLLGL